MAALGAKMERLSSIDAQLRMLVPGKVSEDDKLIEYDALLLDRFLDILQDLHGDDLKEMVQECYEVAAEYETKHDLQKLDELGKMITSLDPGDSIVIAKSFSHMLNLANLAEEVQIAYRRRIKLKKGDFADENSAITEFDIEETLKRLVVDLKKSPAEVFDALKSQTVDLVLTAHPTQSVRRSLLQEHSRIRNCLVQLYSKDITPDDKQELDEALQRAAFRTDEIRRTQPTPQDEMRAGMSYFHETIWKGVPKFLRRVDTALKNIGINERVPYNAPLIQFFSWMGGDRDGNPRVTPEVTRDVCLLARMMASNLYCSQIEDLMFEKYRIKVRGHSVFWDDQNSQMQWVKPLKLAQLKAVIQKRLKSVVSRYAGKVIHWDVVNENLHFNFFETKLGPSASAQIYQQVGQLDRNPILFMNEFNTLEQPGDPNPVPAKYVTKMNQIRSYPGNGGLKLGVGLESHFTTPNLPYMRSSLDTLAKLKLPMWLTEVDVVKSPNQVKYLEQVLREGFGHPNVDGIVMWAAWHAKGCYVMCLTDNSFKNLPVGDLVDKLIAEWKTHSASATTDDNGAVELDLPLGEYEFTISHPSLKSAAVQTMTVDTSSSASEHTINVKS